MIGIQDTLELSAALHGKNNRLADRIFGITKAPHREAPRQALVTPKVHPLRRYTRSTIFSLPGGIGHASTKTSSTSKHRYAA